MGIIQSFLKNILSNQAMATIIVDPMHVETISFSPAAKPPASTHTLFLAGAGVRGLEVRGKFTVVTAIGVYLEEAIVPSLALKWKGKTAQELASPVDDFFKEIYTSPFEKFIRVGYIVPVTGVQFSEIVAQNCVNLLKSWGEYNDSEAKAIEKFLQIFKNKNFAPGSSTFVALLSNGSLVISFSKDESIPEVEDAVIDSKPFSHAILASIIGQGGVSPAARQSMAERLAEVLAKSA